VQCYRVAAELDYGRLVEVSTGVEKQNKNSTAAEPAAHAMQMAPGAKDQLLLLVRLLLAHRGDSVLKQRHAGTAVERDEKWDEQRTYHTQ